MKQVDWANTDSRIQINIDGEEVTILAIYERDAYINDETTITMSTNEFSRLLHEAREAIKDDQS